MRNLLRVFPTKSEASSLNEWARSVTLKFANGAGFRMTIPAETAPMLLERIQKGEELLFLLG